MTAKPTFRTLPRAKRPAAINLAALRKLRIGPIWPEAVADRPTLATLKYRAKRRARRLVARASRRRNRQ